MSVVVCDGKGCSLLEPSVFNDAGSVAIPGPTMSQGSRFTVFTIWSGASLAQRDVDDAVRKIRARGGVPNGVEKLPLGVDCRQVAVRVVAEAPP
jgi:hypothetical protein